MCFGIVRLTKVKFIYNKTHTGSDPTKLDTDGDGLNDGEEVAGWSVLIYWETTKKQIGKPWTVISNPNYIDSDNDGLTDFEELSNGTAPNTSDTDSDGLTDYEEIHFMDLYPVIWEFYEEWADKNNKVLPVPSPTQRDGTPPLIMKVEVKHYDKGWWHYVIRVSGKVYDLSGLDYIKVRIKGQSWKKIGCDGEQSKSFKKDFDVDAAKSLGGGYDVWVEAEDEGGNYAKYKTHLDGLLEGLIKALMKLLTELAKLVEKFLSMLLEWIWKAIRFMMDTVLKPIKDAINNFVNDMANNIKNGYESAGAAGMFVGIVDAVFNSQLYWGFTALLTVIFAVEVLTKPFTVALGIGAIIDFVKPIIVSAIIGAIANGIMETFENGNNDLEDLLPAIGLTLGSAGIIAGLLTMYAKYKTGERGGALKTFFGDIVGLVWGILGIVLILYKNPIPSNPIIQFAMHLTGFAFSFIGAVKCYKDVISDKVSWVGFLGEKITYVIVGISIIQLIKSTTTFLTTPYATEL